MEIVHGVAIRGVLRVLRPIGHYRLITLLDGTDNDDFVPDEQRHVAFALRLA